MVKNIKTVDDAAHEWVREFNKIDTEAVRKLMSIDSMGWEELTLPTIGDRVYVDECGRTGEIVDYDDSDASYIVELDDEDIIKSYASDMEVFRDDELPMWGAMWSFGDELDNYWLTDQGGLQAMSECGFRVYESEEFGYFFGIDGAGYDFYEDHWIPLYKRRGLEWHEQ